MTIESVSREPVPADALVGAVCVFAFCHRVAVVEVEEALVVVGAPVLQVALQGVAVVAQAFERPDCVLAFAVSRFKESSIFLDSGCDAKVNIAYDGDELQSWYGL